MQDNAKNTNELSKNLESTRAHLQGQLRSKEAENNRLTVQIKVCHGHDLSMLLLFVMWVMIKNLIKKIKIKIKNSNNREFECFCQQDHCGHIHCRQNVLTVVWCWTIQMKSTNYSHKPLFALVQNLERAANQQKGEMEHLTEQLARLKQQASTDREALKRATRAQKQRAERSEGTAGQLGLRLLDIVRTVSQSRQAALLQTQHKSMLDS